MSNDDAAQAQRHRERMQRKKALVDAGIARATIERGVVVVTTGNGKGKSSSGFGMVARALGHGFNVGVVQFIKGSFATGEEAFFRRFPDEVSYHVMGEGFTWETQDRERDIRAASAAWDIAAGMLADADVDLVLLDELNIALKYQYIGVDAVVAALAARPPQQHVVITGRAAPQALIDVADTVTEMNVVKHAYQAGIKAQKGIEL
ncbi:cob(I)yrinic acid a,c-diamide adenosyltransferase [Tahibacter aquaticus]|uniref:Corrinoid adenosyltransferase n=1 Tax=Tahibacter aquaticus TaxID=520092 RepID=A0A4R6YNU1_9GAMM|nr:cob(I)yrinic acid a,c-diamide adenosyltransferase [Tahibacter aquaticus]TDR39139.1 cob(I)yrinic acid a,c-diamide adenosyltransferase [Tahibacter aquaticus]